MYFDYAETITRGALVVMGVAVTSCDMAAAADNGAREARKKAPVTPAIVAASQRVLAEHADAPLGSEFPIEVEGKAYVARIEEHDNASGSASRPQGKHTGVTVYERR